jgi:cystathionine beta-lyase
MRQLEANRHALGQFVRRRLPDVRHRPPEATYLAWFDFGALGLDRPVADYLLERGRVALFDGNEFAASRDCARLNFATTRAILTEILERIAGAFGR